MKNHRNKDALMNLLNIMKNIKIVAGHKNIGPLSRVLDCIDILINYLQYTHFISYADQTDSKTSKGGNTLKGYRFGRCCTCTSKKLYLRSRNSV